MQRDKKTAAFAMGGLAGNNSHGAGFLQAALERGVEPVMISCTSGQLLWVGRYLQIRGGRIKKSLRELLKEDIQAINPTGNVNAALANLALFGKPGVFAPAHGEYLQDLVGNAMSGWQKLITNPGNTLMAKEWLELFPCRHLVPDFPLEFFQEIAQVLMESEPGAEQGRPRLPVGIVFNSYNPRTGCEHVYLNDKARELLQDKSSSKKGKYQPGWQSDYRDRTIYQDIDAGAVRDALWLYQYGFDRKESGFIDGAYFRGVILSELAVAERIFCVRPINHLWQGDLPSNYPELEDLKTEIGFDGSYCGERYQIMLVNKLIDKLNAGTGADRYHHIDLQEIEIRQPRGFFDYIFESEQVFDEAYEDAMRCFDRLEY